jgi:hypothetical protein
VVEYLTSSLKTLDSVLQKKKEKKKEERKKRRKEGEREREKDTLSRKLHVQRLEARESGKVFISE